MPFKLVSFCMLFIVLLATQGCNGPPLYELNALEYLETKKVDATLIHKIVNRKPLTNTEATLVSNFDSIPVLHLLAANPTTPIHILKELSEHKNFEVLTGLVSNPSTPLDIILDFRTKGKYTTINDYIARNPSISQQILREMYSNGEIGNVSLALNPNCPIELMRVIFQTGNSIDRAWLATNPNLPEELIEKLEATGDSIVLDHLSTNEKYLVKKNEL